MHEVITFVDMPKEFSIALGGSFFVLLDGWTTFAFTNVQYCVKCNQTTLPKNITCSLDVLAVGIAF